MISNSPNNLPLLTKDANRSDATAGSANSVPTISINITANTSSTSSSNITKNEQEEEGAKDFGTSTIAENATSTKGDKTIIAANNVPPSSDITADSFGENLKILSHLKSIEKINEKRRIFLTNTVNEVPTGEGKLNDKVTLEIETATPVKDDKVNDDNKTKTGEKDQNIHTISEEREETEIINNIEREKVPTTLSIKYATLPKLAGTTVTTLKSPQTPPPKPPMLSRTRSIGVVDKRSSATDSLTTAMVVVANGDPENTSVTEEPVKLRKSFNGTELKDTTKNQSLSITPLSAQTLSPKHYEILVEQLRCPGCANAMKAPIRLCKSGHSICEQCTRILLMCPLCKETFTNTRSLTVEALCAKAYFRCNHAAAGCNARLPIALLDWHEKQCVYKPMKCFMGRVWQDCQWHGREIEWKEHLDSEHANKVFNTSCVDLIWNMAVKQKPLTGYYVFQVHDEMFNFYEIFDRERVLFTMTCTSSFKERKYNFAYEVTLSHPNNEALAITQKFPVHSEYDRDILMDGTCVSFNMTDLNKFIDEEKLLHYSVNILVLKSPRKHINADEPHSLTQFEGGNLKNVSSDIIIARKLDNGTAAAPLADAIGDAANTLVPQNGEIAVVSSDSFKESEFKTYVARKWGTPQLHFNRKYLKSSLNDSTTDGESQGNRVSPLCASDTPNDDKLSLCSTHISYTKKVSNTLRKSFRALKTDLIERRPFSKKPTSPEKESGK